MSATVTLSPEQLAELARLVAEELRGATSPSPSEPVGLVDASTVAAALGVARSWVYAHAGALGATRLGAGRRGRLRFDLERARAAFVAVGDGEPARPAPRARGRRRTSTAGSVLQARPRVPS